MDNIEINGEVFHMGCRIPPAGYTTSLPNITTVPGFKSWDRDVIMDFLKTKPKELRRQQFSKFEWVLDQKQRGSCCPTSTTKAFRRVCFMAGAENVPNFWPEFLYAQINNGSDNGAILADANQAIRDIGVIPDNGMHQLNRDIYQYQYSTEEVKEAANYRADKVFEVNTPEELATLVLSGQGVGVAAVMVGNNFMNINSRGYVGASSGPGNHCITIQDVDLVEGKVAFDMSNSWGLGFGKNGSAYLDWDDHLAPTVPYHKFFVIMSAKSRLFADTPVVTA